MGDYDSVRQRHAQRRAQLEPEYIERIRWPAGRLRQEREQRLRELIRVAKALSPWHRARLSHTDADRVTEADLPLLPPMTKDEMMSNFDAILTDERLRGGAVERHLETLTDDAYLLDEYHVVASGGSSGTRGVFVVDWDAWAIAGLTFGRFRRRHQLADPELGLSIPTVMIAAGKATHMTYAMARTFRSPSLNVTPVPATLPLSEIVARLNELRPLALYGYPSMLYALAREASDGRLRITPRMVGPNSEPLLPEMRRAIEEAWGSPIFNVLGTSEGVAACGCGESAGMHLGEDTAIFELVDHAGKPVPPGVRAAKMYVTNLYNRVQPLIRYELTDEATLLEGDCPCGSAMRRIDDIEGRTDDVFTYRGVVVHPLVFRSRIGHERNIIEYRVSQTASGAALAIRTQGSVDASALARDLEAELGRLGLENPNVAVRVVDRFDRQATGKLKRFIPLN